MTGKEKHKHLGMILDSKLDFRSHTKEAIVRARRGIGMIRYLSKYVSRDVLDQIYKLYVRPHLDYGDIIYHRDDPQMQLNFTQRLEQTQYSAALAVTGAWRGTNRQRLYDELGWETLYHRRWYRRLCHFFKLIRSHSPEYKLFADDTSLFTVIQEPNTAAEDMNHDLELISKWAHDWRMSFNPDPQKQAVELLLSKKRHEIDHPVILFNNIPVQKVSEHKHLGVILDSKLSFSAHIKSAISKTRKGIGLLKHLSKYLPRHTLNELYKLYVRPHLDYGDVIYHIPAKVCEFSHNIILPNLMEKLEAVQYSAAIAVTGTWRGTSREKLYAELGWESLSSRRWSRRLTLFYKIMNNLTPSYTQEPIPSLRQSNYSLRNQDVIGPIRGRTEIFQSSFYPNCISEWNKLDPEIRLAPSVAVFKAKLLSRIRPPPKSVFGIHDPIGLSYLSQIRVGLSKLNFHKFKHNFRDTINPMCPTNDGIEDTEHFLLLCPSFDTQRRDLLAGVSELLQPLAQIDSLSRNVLLQLLLYGDKDFPDDVNKIILQLTIDFIHKTGRLG